MSRSFLKFVFTLLIIVGVTNISQAQDEANITRPSTKAGSAAWVFSFGGLSDLGMNAMPIGLGGGGGATGIGYKYYLSDDMALRARLGFNNSSSGADTLSTGKNSSLNYGIAVGVEMHTRPVYSTSPYFGAQLSFAGNSSTNTKKIAGTSFESKSSGSSLGIGVFAGFDWYFTHAIAVGGEYSLGFSTNSSSSPGATSGATVDNPSSSTIGISSGNVHLVVHF